MNEKLWETAAPLVSDVPLWKCRDALPFQFDDGLCLCELPDWARSQDTLRLVADAFGRSARDRSSPLGFVASSRWAVDQPIRDERDAMRRQPDYLHRDRIYSASALRCTWRGHRRSGSISSWIETRCLRLLTQTLL
jgi:hypothetical protein